MSERMKLMVPDVPALIVTTGRNEAYIFTDDPDVFGGPPEVSGLAAAFLATRLRWWADWIERHAASDDEATP